jgi:hypothetical protein
MYLSPGGGTVINEENKIAFKEAFHWYVTSFSRQPGPMQFSSILKEKCGITNPEGGTIAEAKLRPYIVVLSHWHTPRGFTGPEPDPVSLGMRPEDLTWDMGALPVADPSGYVTFIQDGNGDIEVSLVDNPHERVRLLGEATGEPYTILASIPKADQQMEADTHRMLADCHRDGKWYTPSPKMIAIVCQFARDHG